MWHCLNLVAEKLKKVLDKVQSRANIVAQWGAVAKWLGTGLQNHEHRFESGPRLHCPPFLSLDNFLLETFLSCIFFSVSGCCLPLLDYLMYGAL